MDADNKLIFEAMHGTRGPVLDVAVSELHKMHNALNDMSNMIHMNRSAEVDQLLSKIRDLADMLIADGPAQEDAEHAHCAYAAKGCACNECEECHVNHDKQTAPADEDAEHRSNAQNAAIAISLHKAGKK
jgi:hypothetical protein